MTRHRSIALPAAVLLGGLLSPGLAEAASYRTYVSAAAGTDLSSTCSSSAPCRTFATAFARTSTGGTIVARDPGEYGRIDFDRAVGVEGNGFAVATTDAFANNPVTLQLPPGSRVSIRGLVVDGLGRAYTGVRIRGGDVLLEHVAVRSMNAQPDTAGSVSAGTAVSIMSDHLTGPARVWMRDVTVVQAKLGIGASATENQPLTIGLENVTVESTSVLGLALVGPTLTANVFNSRFDGPANKLSDGAKLNSAGDNMLAGLVPTGQIGLK